MVSITSLKQIITRVKVKWSLLGDLNNSHIIAGPCSKDPVEPKPTMLGGLYINTGHHSDGVTLSLGSGKVMSELLLRRMHSILVSDIDLDLEL